MIDWKARKRACTRAAISDAEEGENRQVDWIASGLGELYKKHYKERRAQIEAAQAQEESLEPLRQIEREADALTSADNEDTRNLARLIQSLAEHLIAKESN